MRSLKNIFFQEGLLLKYYSSDERMDAKNQKNQGGIFYEN